MKGQFYWVEPPNGALYREYIARVKSAMLVRAQLFSAEMRRSAQVNRRWIDRTGHARARLMAKAQWEGTKLVFYLFHQMFYGIFLELRFQGRYRILMPTLKAFFNRILQGLQAIWFGR